MTGGGGGGFCAEAACFLSTSVAAQVEAGIEIRSLLAVLGRVPMKGRETFVSSRTNSPVADSWGLQHI
jgi:hypothetical protein